MEVVVIGNGIAGNSVIEKIRELNKEVNITIISEENCTEYSACVLANYLCGEMEKERLFLKRKEDYRKNRVITIFGKKVIELDSEYKKIRLEDGKVIPYDKLVLATGSYAFIPPIKGLKKTNSEKERKEGIFLFKTVADANEILAYKAQKAVVIGSGPVGIESSIALKKNGYQVTLIEALDWVLPRLFDKESSEFIAEGIKGNDVEVLTGEKVIEIKGTDKVEGIVTDKRKISCDMLIISVGMRANVDLARKAYIEIGKLGGIRVNEFMQTNNQDIYACGDCVETKNVITGLDCLNQLWCNGKQQGDIVAYNILGKKKKYPGSESLMAIHAFNIYGMSIGQTETELRLRNQSEIEVIEKKDRDGYSRVILLKDVVRGVQAINRRDFMGVMMGIIKRKTRIREFEKKIKQPNSLLTNSILYSVRQKYELSK